MYIKSLFKAGLQVKKTHTHEVLWEKKAEIGYLAGGGRTGTADAGAGREGGTGSTLGPNWGYIYSLFRVHL